MDLAESIAAARAFSLYFQLVNILEQRVEEDRYIQSFTNKDVQKSPDNLDPFAPALARQNAPVTFRELFYRLRKLNVPPGRIDIFIVLPIRMFKNPQTILILLLQHWLGKMLR